ncbi:uncharacterized membrane protein YgaE (UPF0421/DUF939 family) [Oikeobacillus pervagus]|uniref:Uncharacterized membrane protein YgaE (UPF0421/DUF939 family) n=1 Tax=Oikeobacillus pervagus TaxID=1325931 RepID=A0AAJ1WKK3_9BACI|nr:aromatic acid exporter family protein [Oikeobacillus pervagus]MDQ0216825.1 uncharacterized membrane protein YgaE (UPF0421/DUF939 family) [Oikeobacillus pervagus]
MKLGARILKTGIAIILALFVAQLLNLPSPVFAGIAAVFAVQPTIYRSYLSIIEQVQGNIIGALIAILSVVLFGNHIVIIGLASIVAITLILKLKIENTIGLALVTLIAIMEVSHEQFIQFALIRFSTIMLGVFSSFVVNLIFLPPKYETKLFHQIDLLTQDILKWMRLISRNASEHHLLKKDIGKIRERLMKLDQLYLMFKEDQNTLKSKSPVKNRKLVIYRHMVSTTRRSFDILRRLHQYENEYVHLPSHLQKAIQEQLDCLMGYHEQLLLKFIGKVKQETELDDVHDVLFNRQELLQLSMAEINEEYTTEENLQTYHLMHIISSILEYDEHLNHLDLLINTFQKFHKEDNDYLQMEEEEI